MKRIITSILLFLFIMCSYAQTKRYYCEVKGIEKELTSGLKIIFDFGNQASYNMWGNLSSKLTTVQRNFPIRSTDHYRSHSEDFLV